MIKFLRASHLYTILLLSCLLASCGFLRRRILSSDDGSTRTNSTAVVQQTPSLVPQGIPVKPKTGMRPYDRLITGRAVTDSGLFLVHRIGERYYYEIPDSLLEREMLLVTRISKSADGFAYGGQEVNNQVFRWARHQNQILLKMVSYDNISSDPGNPITASVKNSNLEPIIASFEIKANNRDSTGVVIEITDLFLKDVLPLNISDEARRKFKVQGMDEARSYIESIRSYPLNIEARSIKTYRSAEPPSNPNSGTITLEINNSMLLLPKKPLTPRLYDARIGYFSQSQVDYSLDPERAKKVQYIIRWRLEPKDKAAYDRGELVEPKKPIVFYIDPATPLKWRPYLKQGIEDWQKAFEAAGFKHAILARDPPDKKEDPDFSLDDARYSVIRYFASETQNAYGPYIADPRSGEVLESHVGWYHNVMNILKDWYVIQTGAVNPDARSLHLKDSVMGRLIRYVASHEVGHTLGMQHNFGASHSYPVDSLRSLSFTRVHGICASIMDYARFNYVAQPRDKSPELVQVIGPYDRYAIHWGYRLLQNTKTPENERDSLNHWILEKQGQNDYFFGRQTSSPVDPRSQAEDLGDNAMKASAYGIANLKRILPNLEQYAFEAGHNYDELEEFYDQLVLQYNRYLGHVRTNIGGTYEDFKSSDQRGAVYTTVPAAIQKDAMHFLSDYCFDTPTWLINTDVTRKFEGAGIMERVRKIQAGTLNGILDPGRLQRIIENSALDKKNTYAISDLMGDLRLSIWKDLYSKAPLQDDPFRRNLQRSYIERLNYLLTGKQAAPPDDQGAAGFTAVNMSSSDIRAVARMELKTLKADIQKALPGITLRIEQSHLEDVLYRINKLLLPSAVLSDTE